MNATFAKPTPTLESLRPVLAAFGRAHPEVQRIELFGSVARGEATSLSDVDLVVEFMPGSVPRGMAGFAFLDDLECELAADLNVSVDLITSGSVRTAAKVGNRSLARAVARDARVVYEAEPAAA